MKRLAITLCGTLLMISSSVFADNNNTKTGALAISAPVGTTITPSTPTASDLTFTQLPTPNILYRAWYMVKTNAAGQGSGTVSMTYSGTTCQFELFYSAGWQVRPSGNPSVCSASVNGWIVTLTFPKATA